MMSACCLAAGGLDCAKQHIMPLTCYACAICQQTDKCASEGGLHAVEFQNPGCETELLPSAAQRQCHHPFAYICIPMLKPRHPIQLLLQKNVALAAGLGCANDRKALPFQQQRQIRRRAGKYRFQPRLILDR